MTATDTPTRERGLDILPLAITPTGVDPDRLMLADVDTSAGPVMPISFVSFLLARTTTWTRWREPSEKFAVLDENGGWWVKEVVKGDQMRALSGPYGTEAEAGAHLGQQPFGSRTKSGARSYTLSQLEQFVHYLAREGHLSGSHAAYALGVVYYLALEWGYLSPTTDSMTVQPDVEDVL